jgi:hypothetical protein
MAGICDASVRYQVGRILLCPPSHNQLVIERGFTFADEKTLARWPRFGNNKIERNLIESA